MKKKKIKKYKAKVVSSQVPIDSTQAYLREIGKFPILSKKEERKISEEFYKTRDPRLAQILAQSNLRFVVKIAAEYTRFGSRLIDLVQEGNIGLLHAIKEFNPYKGVRLITYAVWWIRGYIQEYLMRQYSLVRIGTNTKQRKLFYLLKKQQQQLARLPYNNTKLLTHAGFKEEDIRNMQQRISSRDVSLDQPLSEDGPPQIINLPNSDEKNSLEENINFLQEKKFLQKTINRIKPKLNNKEIFVLEKRLLSDSPLTLQKIGEHFSVTREAIRQVENKLIRKIKDQFVALK